MSLGPMATVLVIEDDADIRVLLATALRSAGHTALVSANGRAGLEMIRRGGVELIILDMILPDMGGDLVVETLKSDAATRSIPVIILSGRAGEADRVEGLELGADDYVTKPFSVKELILRMKVALRRSEAPAQPGLLTFDSLRIETDTHRAFLDGVQLALTPIEFRLLTTLASRPERVQSRQSLLADVWGMQPDLETRTVDAHIRRLREKLGYAAEFVETVRGIGYRFRDPDTDLAQRKSAG